MKKRFIYAAFMLLMAFNFIACGGDDPVNPESSINVSDAVFKKFLVSKFDTNQDGVVSYTEVQTVTSIDCSGQIISDLDGIKNFTSLQELKCNNIKDLKSIDVSGITTLKVLNCENCANLNSINVGNNTALEEINCSNTNMASINLDKNTALKTLLASNCGISSIDLNNNVALEMLNCSHNKLKTIDLSKNVALKILDCSYNELETLDLGKHTKIENVLCNDNKLSPSLDVAASSILKEIDCRNNSNLGYLYINSTVVNSAKIMYDSDITSIKPIAE